jgi:hypothetical protein
MSKLSWGQKFALIDTYKLADEVACSKLGVTANELKTAKTLLSSGTFSVDTTFDSSRYAEAFNPNATPVKKTSGSTSHKTNSVTGEVEAPKKRGRKGDKITKAFQAITPTPVAAEPFIRQSKRFDKSGVAGTIHVKKREGSLMVWREVPLAPAAE